MSTRRAVSVRLRGLGWTAPSHRGALLGDRARRSGSVLAAAGRAGPHALGDPDAKPDDRPAIAHGDRDGLAEPEREPDDRGGQSDPGAHLP